MKFPKKILMTSLSLSLLLLGVVSTSAVAFGKKYKEVEQIAATDEYTTYYNCDLGFTSRRSDNKNIVIGDTEGGMQTKGHILSEKSELRLAFRKEKDLTSGTRLPLWIGVGGYAFYFANTDSDNRFLYLGHKDSGTYDRHGELPGLVFKTDDGSATLSNVLKNFTNVTMKFDFTDENAVTVSLVMEYEGVKYYPYNGSSKIEDYTYTHKPKNFSDDDKYRVMSGVNATDSGVTLFKFESLSDIISPRSNNFYYDYIGDFIFSFTLSKPIFPKSSLYLNNHLSEFKDDKNNVIDIGDGLIINGKTFKEWVDYEDPGLNYGSDIGVHQFPLSEGSIYNPIALYLTDSKLEFKINTDYIPIDSVVVTFKAGIFLGFNNNLKYTLEEDLTYYATLDTTADNINHTSRNIKFTTDPSETVQKNYIITNAVDNGLKTNSNGFKYYQFTLYTNIPRDTNLNNPWTQDHYRYLYSNILINGITLSKYNSFGRANSLDSTNEYETVHATGSANTQFDLSVQLKIATDQDNFVMWIYFPVKLMDDFGFGYPTFSMRDGSAWASSSGVVRINCLPQDRYVIENFIEDYLHMTDYKENLGYCKDSTNHYYKDAKDAYNDDLSDTQKDLFGELDIFAQAKERYETWAAFNNDSPYNGNPYNASERKTLSLAVKDNKYLIVISLALISIGTVTSYFIIKRRKESNI